MPGSVRGLARPYWGPDTGAGAMLSIAEQPGHGDTETKQPGQGPGYTGGW